MKKVLIALVVLVLVVGLGIAGLVYFGTGKILKMGIEKGGTYATGVDTTVDRVKLSLTKGTFDMDGFKMANPPGFSTPHFIALVDTNVTLNAAASGKNVVTLSSLTLSGIDLILDKGGNPSNYNTVLNNLKRFESGEKGPPPAESEARRVVIESLVIEDVGVRLANMPGLSVVAGDVAVRVPRIELRDVGKDNPMSTGEVIGLVVKTVLAASIEAGGGIIPGDVLGDLKGGLGSLRSLSDLGITGVGDLGKAIEGQIGAAGEQVQKALDEAKKAGEDLQKQADGIKDSVNEAKDNLKNIFGGNKDDKP